MTSLARGASLILGWQASRALLQGIWAIGLARMLGPSNYGLFAGLAGLAAALGTLTGIGFGLLMLKNVSRRPETFAQNWTRVLLLSLVSSGVLLAIFLVSATSLASASVSAGALVAIALPELLCVPLLLASGYAFQAHEHMAWGGGMAILAPLGNVIALSLFAGNGAAGGLSGYLAWHLWAALAATAAGLLLVRMKLRPRVVPPRVAPGEFADAGGYAVMRSIDVGLGTLDKTLVLRLAGEQLAGQYTAAYRLAALIALPMVSLAVAATPRLFRSSELDTATRLHLVRKLALVGLAAGLASMPVAWLGAQALPALFGPAFQPAALLASAAFALPGLLGTTTLGCSILMTMGGRTLRIVAQTFALAMLAALMILLVPAWHGRGAMLSIQATLLCLSLVVWALAFHSARQKNIGDRQ